MRHTPPFRSSLTAPVHRDHPSRQKASDASEKKRRLDRKFPPPRPSRLPHVRCPFADPSPPFPLPPDTNSGRVASFGNLSEMSAQSANDADERSAADITSAKETVLESDHLAFVAAVVSGDIAASPVATTTESSPISSSRWGGGRDLSSTRRF